MRLRKRAARGRWWMRKPSLPGRRSCFHWGCHARAGTRQWTRVVLELPAPGMEDAGEAALSNQLPDQIRNYTPVPPVA